MSDKRKALLAYKEKILKEIDYYGSRISELSTGRSKSSIIEDSDSSDSEVDFLQTVDTGPTVPQLKQQQSSLKTCLQATQELTSLQVLQSEVNVLVEAPVIVGEPPVSESGVWREVTAECRVDLVPFSISFYVHQPDRRFGSCRYRSVRAVAVRAAHASELESTVLNAVSTPSDAVEVLKNYACAHRSRRTTLARLATKHGDTLHMEPMPEGGYMLKCANLLEVSWTLQNKWSPVAPFHHRMKFNLEYMDESYIKIITQAHRQLSDPTIETDERTFLLSKIISTCLEAQGPTQELYESMSSDPETTETLRKRRTTLDQEPEQPIVSKNKDREVMAPPKSLPKKAKPKGKENMVENRKTKRVTEDFSKAKKAKLDEVDGELKSDKNNLVEEKVGDKISPKNRESTKKTVNKDNNAVDKVTEKDNDKMKSKDSEGSKNNVANLKKTVNKDNDITDNVNEKDSAKINPKNRESTKNTVSVPKKPVNKDNNVLDKVNEKDGDKISPKGKENTKSNVAKPKNIDAAKTGNNNADKVKKPASGKANTVNNEIKTKAADNEKTKTSVKKTVETKKDLNKPKDSNNAKNNEDNKKDKVPPKSIKNNDKTKKVISKETLSDEKSNEKVINKVAENNKKANSKIPAKKDEQTTESLNNKEKTKKVAPKETVVVEKPEKSDKNKQLKNADAENVKNQNENPVKATKSIPLKTKSADENTNKTAKNKKENDNANKPKSQAVVASTEKNKEAKANAKASTTNLNKNKQDSAKSKPVPTSKDKPTKTVQSKPTTNKENAKNTNQEKETTIEKAVEKNTNLKRKSNLADKDADSNVAITKKPKLSKPDTEKETNNKENDLNKPQNIKPIAKQKPKFITNSMKTLKTGNIRGVFSAGNVSKQSSERASKIPQKRLSKVSEATLKKNPLRISPRKIPSKFKTPAVSGNKFLVAQKTTSIPRLMKKPSPKM